MPPSQQDSRGARKRRKPTLQQESGLWEAAQRFWRKSHADDYTGIIILVVLFTLLKLLNEPFHQQFRLNDPRIQHPFAEVERVSVVILFIYALGIPLLVLVLWTSLYRPDGHKAHVTILGLVISILATTFITDVLKDAIGRPRPDLIQRCSPDPATPKDRLVNVDACTQTDHHKLHDGWRSFPSGHSSFAFAGLGWLAFFLASQTHCLHPRTSLLVALLCLAPLLGAALIAISRLEDYRHDVFDVIVGSLLGFAVAAFNWHRYYPSLLARQCDEPHPPPNANGMQSPSGGAFQRIRDEEDGIGDDGNEQHSRAASR